MSIPREEQMDVLFQSILSLQNVEECYQFFEDLCTVKELHDMTQRLHVARLMHAGSSYLGAQNATGASSATIGRVKRCLDYGTGGYATIIERMQTR